MAFSFSTLLPARALGRLNAWLTLRDEPRLQGHLPALDSVRGLAILMVTLFRFSIGSGESSANSDWLSSFMSLGGRGVDLFFVLSGFLITGILFDAKGKENYFRNFYMRRTLRIFPLYYGVLLLVLVVLPALGLGARQLFPEAFAQQGWLWFYGANVLQSIRGEWCLGRFNHFWSLAVEEHFYLLWPLVIFTLSRKWAMGICGALIVGVTCARVAWLYYGGNDVAANVFTLLRMDSLAMGGLLALAIRRPGGIRSLYPFAVAGAVLLGTLLIPIGLSQRRLLALPETLFAAFFACVILLAVCAAQAGCWGKLWNSRLLQFLGKYSYGMYVFQNLLIPVLAPVLTIEILQSALGNIGLARVAYLILMSLTTTAAAVASWHLFEKHILKLKPLFGG